MNVTNLSNLSSPSSFTPNPYSAIAPSPVFPSSYSAIAPSPAFPSPSSFKAFAPSPHNATFHRFNHSTSVSSIHQQEINFFLAYVAISFGIILVFLFFTRKHLHNLLVDSRQYVDVAPGDTELKRVFTSDGESKSYGFAQLDELEHKERSVGEGADI